MIELHRMALAYTEPRAIIRLSNKGATHRKTDHWPVALAWNEYMLYWNVDHWQENYQGLVELGYDTSGCNWHTKDDPTGHYSGTWWWARSDYIAKIPPLTLPHLVLFKQQLPAFSPRHDAEVWIGQGKPNYQELHHYEHAVVYHVPPPATEDYKKEITQ
jgi:hypothetical protein